MIQLAMSTRGFATDELSRAAALAKQAGIRHLEIPVATLVHTVYSVHLDSARLTPILICSNSGVKIAM